ncbi:MAG: PIN domain-containing protein [Thiohalocapsa sp.]
MGNVTHVLFDSTIIVGAHFADQAERDACQAVLSLAEQGRIRAHICGNALGHVIEDLARVQGSRSTNDWLKSARRYIEVVATSADILDAAMDDSLENKRIYFDDAITIHTARLHGFPMIVTLNCADFDWATTGIAPPEHLLAQFPISRQTATG